MAWASSSRILSCLTRASYALLSVRWCHLNLCRYLQRGGEGCGGEGRVCGEGVWSGREAVALLPLVKGEGWAEGLRWLGSA